MPQGIQTVFGTGTLQTGRVSGTDEVREYLDACAAAGITTLDTAQAYGDSEIQIGKAGGGERFTIDTKNPGQMMPGATRRDVAVSRAQESVGNLKVSKVDVYYLHSVPEEGLFYEALDGMNDVYKLGIFERLGLSNYTAEEVQNAYDYCKSKGYVLPSVYQGNYSAVARRYEAELLPTLRKLNISFYAYSPLAGGFLTKTKEQIVEAKTGRFNKDNPIGQMYLTLYNKPAYLESLAQWTKIAKEAGCAPAELAYRWVKYNSPLKPEHGDAIIIGASSVGQLKQTTKGLESGPLDAAISERIDALWETIKHEAPLDNISALPKKS